ncbi:hypothetical protein [Actinospica sp.]|jgi:hypothetical protein|uniref:hypothetical protein n=1 Tax=Actinospica sp. TaxID=1872142 RepID=UPI002C3A8D61|nr:hypothetical protein [Actinospica sp.]HWG24909.1 hypothetical protein [Actinospica sp.]
MSQDTEIPESSEGAETTEITRVVADADGDPAAELSAEELLSIPPRADDLAAELATRPARVKLPRVTLALAVGVLLGAGFVGGVLVQKHLGSSSGGGQASSIASSFAAARGGGAGRGGFGGGTGTGTGGFGTGGSSISGSITVVSGNTLYITASNGTVYTVTTSGSTSVKVSSTSSLSQLKPGQTVTISGTQGTGGTVTATSITAGN